MHHRIVKIRVKFLSLSLDRLHADILQRFLELFAYLVHAFRNRVRFRFIRNDSKSPLEIVQDGKHLCHDILDRISIDVGFFLLRPLAVILILRKCTHVAVLQCIQFFFFLCKFLFILPAEKSVLFIFGSFFGARFFLTGFGILFFLAGSGICFIIPVSGSLLFVRPGSVRFIFSVCRFGAVPPVIGFTSGSLLLRFFCITGSRALPGSGLFFGAAFRSAVKLFRILCGIHLFFRTHATVVPLFLYLQPQLNRYCRMHRSVRLLPF